MMILDPYRLGAGGGGGGGGGDSLDNPAFYYKFEDGSWTDSAAGGNDGTGHNSPSSVSGKVGNCLDLSGASNKYISVPYADVFNVSRPAFTIACWVYLPASPADFGRIWCRAHDVDTDGNPLSLYYHSGLFNVSVRNASASSVAGASATTFGTLSPETWYFVVVQVSDTQTKISVNGGAFDTQSLGGPPFDAESGGFNIGLDDLSNTNYMAGGKVDSLGGWHYLLSGGDIAALYASGTGADPI